MNPLRSLLTFFNRRKIDTEMAEEMRLHLEQRTQENVAAGMSADDARDAALRRFGGVEQAKERARQQRLSRWLEDALKDFGYALRQLRRSPGFALTAIGILAFGIGATAAIFSIVNSVVLKPLPYEQPGQLVIAFEAAKPGNRNSVSPGIFNDWREHLTTFEGLAAFNTVSLNLGGTPEPQRLDGLRMSANALQLLRVQPKLGRLFAPEEGQVGQDKVVLLSQALWQNRFGGARDIVGRNVLLNDESYTVIGVLPTGFWSFREPEFITPLTFGPQQREQRGSHFLDVLGRLRPGVTLAQAQAELNTLVENRRSFYPTWKREWGGFLVPLHEELVTKIKPTLLVLLGAVGLVLLLACTNVANLLLVRASARQKEISVRAALGASRGRIVRQLLAESVLLSGLGAALGLVLAGWAVEALRHWLGTMNFARAHEIALDGRVLGAALVVSVLTGLVFGLAPALQSAKPDLNLALKDAARGSASGGARLRSLLIVGEVALALALLVGAGLLLHSFARVLNAPAGFVPEQAVTLQLTLSRQRYPDHDRQIIFYHQLAERVAALPGVTAAGLNTNPILQGGWTDRFFRVIGRAEQPEVGYDIDFDFCTSGYFEAMGIALRRGRPFTTAETASGARLAVINEATAREIFPNEDPLGRHLGYDNQTWEIVGIVADMRVRNLIRPAQPMIYRPAPATQAWRSASLVVRTAGSPLAVVESVRQIIRELDPALPIASVQTLEQVVSASVADRRLTLSLLGGFAAAALVLAATGLYGVIAYAVGQRRREFGIRVALGASRGQLQALVVGQGVKLALLGVLVGVAAALGLSRLLESLLYDIKPTDPLTFGAVSLLLLAVAALAAWLPARAAARVDAMIALRAE